MEPTAAPEFIVPLSNIMARAGQKIKLECEVTGLPQPQLLWTHNGRLLKEGRDVKVRIFRYTLLFMIIIYFLALYIEDNINSTLLLIFILLLLYKYKSL